MRKTIENIIIGILFAALLLAVLGVILSNAVLTKSAFVVLMIVAVIFTILQVMDYFDSLKIDDMGKRRTALWFMIVTVIVSLVIVCVSILALAGKLFN